MRWLPVLSLCGGVIVAPAYAQQWRAVVENDQKPFTVMFLDQSTLAMSSGIATGQVLTVMEEDPAAKRDWDYWIIGRRADCKKAQVKITSSKFFRKEELISEDNTESEWVPVRKGSMLESVTDVMCGRQGYLTPVVENPVAMARTYFEKANEAKKP